MVVGLDLEDRGEAVSDVHCAGVLARPLQHPAPGRRQRLEMHARALVAAVLRPHDREDPELGQRRLAPEHLDDAGVFVVGNAVTFEKLLIDD
jgi:hypothetical protein